MMSSMVLYKGEKMEKAFGTHQINKQTNNNDLLEKKWRYKELHIQLRINSLAFKVASVRIDCY